MASAGVMSRRSLALYLVQDGARAFNVQRRTVYVAHVRLDPLVLLQLVQESLFKDHVVVHGTSGESAVQPANVASLDVEANFVPESALLGLVRPEHLALPQCDEKVRPIDGHQAVVAGIPFLPVFE